MSEYTNVEHPFLEKLRQLDWEVINHNEEPNHYTGTFAMDFEAPIASGSTEAETLFLDKIFR
jgi:hypothetical protein